jgi:hypothetical protein
LLTVSGQDPTQSNVILTAPHGVIDAGAAGIRVAGDLHLSALQVLNSFNIEVGGVTTGLFSVQGPPVAALNSANNTAGAAAKAAEPPAQSNNNERPSVIIVEVLGYGGAEGSPRPEQMDEERRHRDDARQGSLQDSSGPARVVGYGSLTERQKQLLSERSEITFK